MRMPWDPHWASLLLLRFKLLFFFLHLADVLLKRVELNLVDWFTRLGVLLLLTFLRRNISAHFLDSACGSLRFVWNLLLNVSFEDISGELLSLGLLCFLDSILIYKRWLLDVRLKHRAELFHTLLVLVAVSRDVCRLVFWLHIFKFQWFQRQNFFLSHSIALVFKLNDYQRLFSIR